MIFTRGTTEGEITFRERDIRMLCPSDRKNSAGFTLYTLWIYLADLHKPIAANYESPQERDTDFMRIRSAWEMGSKQVGELAEDIASIGETVRSMQAALEKTELQISQWEKLQASERQKKKAPAGQRSKTLKRTEAEKMIAEAGLPEGIEKALMDWMKYKYGRKQTYQAIGVNKIIKQVREAASGFGEKPVIDEIDKAIGNRYEGFHLDGLKKPGGKGGNQFTKGVENNSYDFEALEDEFASEIESGNEKKENTAGQDQKAP